MNRIEEAFRNKKRPLLIPYITGGDPSLDKTEGLIFALEEGGADIIELGIPFSDPIADGPIIQEACNRALKKGASLKKIIELVGRMRKKTKVPIVLLSYYNPIYKYGISSFIEDAEKNGVDGLIVADLPPEEGEELRKLCVKKGICLIFLLAPTSPPSRIKLISNKSSGFVYYVSLLGITGIREKLRDRLIDDLVMVRKFCPKPIALGFGISKPEHVKEVLNIVDGVIIGSAIVDIIAKNQENPEEKVKLFVNEIKKACKK
ncbi:TPA: tryptophan synthase subunit alpha [bacterium]|nr:tryptophan synthase subunit alpha [bacterium]